MKQFIPRFFVTLICMVTVISILAVTSHAVSSEPVEIIHGKDVVVGFFYPGRSTSNKAINLEYDKEAYTSSLVTNTDMNINDVDNTYYKVYLGLDNLVKDAPCVALGVSYSSSVDVEISIQTDDHMSDTETHKLNNTVSKLIFDLSDIGYSNSELYKYLRIGTGIDNGEILPKGTKLSVEYIAFFADIDAAKAYVYEKPVDTAPIYVEDNHIKSVSFNVLTAGHTLSPVARAPYMARTILEYEPDIIGLQEANATWYSELAHLFGEGYGSIVKWRTTTDSESTPIFYKKDKFELLDSGYFWLSDTPDVQSLGWGANFHRICCWVKLKIKTTGKEFYYFNTHWDFSEAPQLGSAKLFYDKIKNKCQDLPVILTADFNMTWNSEGYAMLRSFLTESNHERNPQHTYNNLNDGANSILIDYLFYTADSIISQNYTVIKDRIITDDYNYHLSDHYGIFNDLYFLGTPNEYTLSFKNELTQTLIPDIIALENVTTNLPRGEPVLGKRFIGWSADGGKTLVNDCFTAYADTVFFAYYEDAENYTVTYLTGERVYKSEIVAAGSAYKIITDTTDIIPEPGYYFYGWVNSDGKKLEGTIEQVIEDIILYAGFKEIVPLKDYYVLTPVDLTPSTNGFTISVVEESDTDTSYFRYTVTTDGTSHDNTRAYLKPSSEAFFPLQFSLHDYKYLKIGYRSNITTTAKMGMNLWSVGSRIYGPDVTVKYNNSWQTHVYDLSILNSGEAGATFENSCDGPLKNLFIKPYAASNTVMKSGEYFDIQYIALFDNLKEAENFKYSYTFSYDTLGGKDGPASADVFPGTELTISDIIPSKKDRNFLGWTDNAQSSEVKYRAGDKITVDNADVTLYAVWDTAHYIFDLDNYLSFSGTGGLTAEAHQATSTETSFVRYYVNGSLATSNDNTRAYVKFDSSFSLADYPIMKVAYRAGASDSSKTTILGMNFTTKYGRLWGVTGDNFKITHDCKWKTQIYDLSTAIGGIADGSYSSPTGVYNFSDCGNSPLLSVLFKPYKPDGGMALTKDDYFDIRYVAFFKNTDDAAAYVYPTPAASLIIGDLDKNGTVEALDGVNLSRYLANWAGYSAEIIDLLAADVDNDGEVLSTDSVILSRHLAKWFGYESLPYIV